MRNFQIIIIFLEISKIIDITIRKGGKILLFSSQTIMVPNNICEEMIIPNNYKKLIINIDSKNISQFVLTDIKIENDLNLNCLSNSTFCIKNMNPNHNTLNINYCLDNSYLYICGRENSYITISIDVIKNEGCQIEDFTEEIKCSSLGINNCKKEENCNLNCQYIECLKGNNEKLFNMCLPINYTINQITERCSYHVDFDIDGKIYYKKCTKIDNYEDSSSHKFFKGFAIFFGVGILVLFMLSVYYRFQTSMDVNRPPFNPPWWCPNFIFPRVVNQY